MGDNLRATIFQRLKHSAQLLACPFDMQSQLLPHYVCKGDELALEFDHWREVVLHNYSHELNSVQLSALAELDDAFESLTAQGKEHWADEAIRSSAEWQNVRHLAVNLLTAFGWSAEIPPSYAHEYVSPTQFKRHFEN